MFVIIIKVNLEGFLVEWIVKTAVLAAVLVLANGIAVL